MQEEVCSAIYCQFWKLECILFLYILEKEVKLLLFVKDIFVFRN